MMKAMAARTGRDLRPLFVIVLYGGFMANLDVVGAKQPYVLRWFWAVILGVLPLAFVVGLLRDDDE
jgi:hypothetical protein